MKKPRLVDVRVTLTGVLGTLLAAAALSYAFPSRHMFRGAVGLALLVTLCYGVCVYGHITKKFRLADVNAALFAMLVALGVTGALYAAFPSLRMFGGVANITVLLAG